MPNRRTTLSKFIIEDQRRRTAPDRELAGLLNDIQTACKFIASAISRGKLYVPPSAAGDDAGPVSIGALADQILLRESEWGGQLCGILSSRAPDPYPIPELYPRGSYLLAFNALEGTSDLDIGLSVGTIFSVLRAPAGPQTATAQDFLQPGTRQVAAGFALYGAVNTIVLTLGSGVHGFTLDREIGAYTLTDPDMKVDVATHHLAISSANQRMWDDPVRHYVSETLAGSEGERGADFDVRYAGSLAAETYRVLVRGGVFIYPAATGDAPKSARLRSLYEANPIAFIIEEAGGAASTGRERVLARAPQALHETIPAVFGSREEVERITRYYDAHDRGEELTLVTPLFNARSLFRTG